jgi:uncharacterized membrane protein
MIAMMVGINVSPLLLAARVPEFMRVPLMVHVAAGLLGIVAGFVALYAVKGATVHRTSGRVFVYAMVTMGLLASVVAASEPKLGSVIGGLFSAYLVITALTTVRPPTDLTRRVERSGMLLAFAVGLSDLALGCWAFATPKGTLDGVPAAVILTIGMIALFAGVGDLRMIRAGGIRGPRRLARHLWRMCFSLFIAAGSFFLGQAKFFPKPIRIFPVLVIPPLLSLVAMGYWLWRIRVRRKFRGLVVAVSPDVKAA